MTNTISNNLSKINNSAVVDKKSVSVKKSKLTKEILTIFKKYEYVENIEDLEDGKQGILKIELCGKINKCGSIWPRNSIKVYQIEEMEKKYLPAKDFGIIIISTSKGLLTQFEAKKQNLGGALIGYCY